ncbi:MAG TPA: alpha-N-acetylglucosaminidase TIM-barrel domain-containing protein [Ilumatobacter sp.]|nr:alpha-N-acetylglucosaminidase TIM-barrel domain-containing protein [Ilumatobacter sp.]
MTPTDDLTAASSPWRRRAGDARVLGGLAERVLGAAGPRVTWQLAPGTNGFDARHHDGGLHIAATDALTAANGLHRYLTDVAGRRVCWDTPLPLGLGAAPAGAATGRLPAEVAYYLNFCTFGYTTAGWDWERWQREIDWMALHGITMPLAAVGHEAVLAEVYRAAGLTDTEITAFLGGPAYLPWQLMGCLDHWGAQLDRRWLDERLELGRRIVERELEYGMTPVLPGFVGHVPPQLAGAGTTTREWWGFTTHLLDPLDARFGELVGATVAAQTELLGTAHLYAADPFIEMEPPDDDPAYLANVANSLVAGLRAADPAAVWVMQAWTFDYLDWWTDARVAHFLDSIPDDAMLVLDLWGEHSAQWRRFDGFRGKPWIWCALHDFGGRNDLFGAAGTALAERHAAEAAADAPLGIGLAMEATEQNHVVYELVLDPPPATSLDDWVVAYARQRAGTTHPVLERAWSGLLATVYATPAARHEPTERPSAITLRPTLDLLDPAVARAFAAARATYPAAMLHAACADLAGVVVAHPELAEGSVGHDLVAAVATLAGRAADATLVRIAEAWHAPGRAIGGPVDGLLGLLADLDALLDGRPELRLATWEDAHAGLGHTEHQATALRRDARRLVSMWNHAETAPLTDYSARLWSGLVAGLYRERWRVWAELLTTTTDDLGPRTVDELDRRVGAVTDAFVEHGWRPAAAAGDRDADTTSALDRLLAGCARALDLPIPSHDSAT